VTQLHANSEKLRPSFGLGDFPRLATTMVIVGERLCEAVDVRAGQRVVDVATGSGNAALAAARRWCRVIGIDIEPSLLEKARERAAIERLPVNFVVGDAEALPFPDDSFDVALSTFTTTYSSEHELNEMLRVCRPGGKIGTVHWTEASAIRLLMGVVQGAPQPPQKRRPLRQMETYIRGRFGNLVSSVQVRRNNFVFRYESPQHWVDFFSSYFAPVMQALEPLEPDIRASRKADLLGKLKDLNQSEDETLVLPSEYLEVVAIKR
jgi:ubiquinone/menaquinone biosynthesis C-methylase UbiE